MTCRTISFDGANDEERCKCKGAVLRAYKSMASAEPAQVALSAALRVYRYHHPEDSKEDASLTVERWVNVHSHH